MPNPAGNEDTAHRAAGTSQSTLPGGEHSVHPTNERFPPSNPRLGSATFGQPQAAGNLHRIAIVGGGAGGLELAVRLGDDLGRRGKAEVVLIDAQLTHLWKPLLHEVAAGTLGQHENEFDFLQQARRHHFRFRLGRLETIDRSRQLIWLAPLIDEEDMEIAQRRPVAYDTLIIAVGSIDNDFGTPGARAFSFSLNRLKDAERFHRRLLALCAKAELGNGNPVRIVIVGGGATGVELAAELTGAGDEIASYGMQLRELRHPLSITLIEAGPRLVPALPKEVARRARNDLKRRQIIIRLNQRVAGIDAKGVVLAGGERIDAELVVWAAGVQGPAVLDMLDGLKLSKHRQLLVGPTLQTTADSNVFAFGDCASCVTQPDGAPVPPTAQAASQQARLLARSLHRRVAGMPPLAFNYRTRGSLISLGGLDAVGSIDAAGGRTFTIEGMLASFSYWLLYRRHLATLLGIPRTLVLTVGQWLARRSQARVKLH